MYNNTIFKTETIGREYRYDIANRVPFYLIKNRYEGIVERCGDTTGKYPTYTNVKCLFESSDHFADWFFTCQDSYRPFYVGKYEKRYEYQLDKDLLCHIFGTKMYHPKTCIFLPKYLNTMLETNAGQRRDLPIGVTKGRVLGGVQTYSIYTTVFGKSSHILIDRSCRDIEVGHIEYKLGKEYVIRRTAEEFYKRGFITPIAYYAIMCYVVKDDTDQVSPRPYMINIVYNQLLNKGVFNKLESKLQEYTIPELDKMTEYIQTYPMKDMNELLGPYERSLLYKYIYKGEKPSKEEYDGVFKRRLENIINGDMSVPKFSDYDLTKMRK